MGWAEGWLAANEQLASNACRNHALHVQQQHCLHTLLHHQMSGPVGASCSSVRLSWLAAAAAGLLSSVDNLGDLQVPLNR